MDELILPFDYAAKVMGVIILKLFPVYFVSFLHHINTTK